MIVRKKYGLTVSKKFSDGTLIVEHFGTEFEEDGADPKELFDLAYRSTIDDTKTARKKDKLVKAVFDQVKDSMRKEERVKEGERLLEED